MRKLFRPRNLTPILKESIIYPHTFSLRKEHPRVEYANSITNPELKEFIQNSIALKTYYANEEINQVVNLLVKHQQDFLSTTVDAIDIKKGGMTLLRVWNWRAARDEFVRVKNLTDDPNTLNRAIVFGLHDFDRAYSRQTDHNLEKFNNGCLIMTILLYVWLINK